MHATILFSVLSISCTAIAERSKLIITYKPITYSLNSPLKNKIPDQPGWGFYLMLKVIRYLPAYSLNGYSLILNIQTYSKCGIPDRYRERDEW